MQEKYSAYALKAARRRQNKSQEYMGLEMVYQEKLFRTGKKVSVLLLSISAFYGSKF